MQKKNLGNSSWKKSFDRRNEK